MIPYHYESLLCMGKKFITSNRLRKQAILSKSAVFLEGCKQMGSRIARESKYATEEK